MHFATANWFSPHTAYRFFKKNPGRKARVGHQGWAVMVGMGRDMGETCQDCKERLCSRKGSWQGSWVDVVTRWIDIREDGSHGSEAYVEACSGGGYYDTPGVVLVDALDADTGSGAGLHDGSEGDCVAGGGDEEITVGTS